MIYKKESLRVYIMAGIIRHDGPHNRVRPFVWASGMDPARSWDDKGSEEYLSPTYGRGADMMCTEDEPLPSRTYPAAMDFQAPLHTPYGTGERTYDEFWGAKNPLLDRRGLLPDYVVAEHEWDRNPRECGKRASNMMANPYEVLGSAGFGTGANIARTIGVKEASMTQYMRFSQNTNPTAYGADPFMSGGAGGGVPVLQSYLGKKGSTKPLFTRDYIPPAGGAMPSAPPVEPDIRLPAPTRSNRQYEEVGNVTGGNAVSTYGDEDVNPQRGGRPSLMATEYEHWGYRNGGFVSSGADWTLWNPNDGARYRNIVDQSGANDPIVTGAPISVGPSLDLTPKVGGRESMRLNFDRVLGGGVASGQGSGLENNPQEGGRVSMNVNWDAVGSGGVSSGVGSSLQQNPQRGGRTTKLINWDMSSPAGMGSGVGSSLENNPQEGGRISLLHNWQVVNPGGVQSGVSGINCNNILGGNHWTRSEGCPDYIPPGGSLNPDYGGLDVAFGLEVQPRAPRTEVTSIMIPGAGGRGTPKIPEMFITLPNTQINGDGVYDDSPDPLLQFSARSTVGAKNLLNFTQENIDDLAFVVPCI